jgi:preprotein translocase subunit YajC
LPFPHFLLRGVIFGVFDFRKTTILRQNKGRMKKIYKLEVDFIAESKYNNEDIEKIPQKGLKTMLYTALTATTTDNGGSMWITLVLMAVVFVAFYFFGVRPQKKQEKETAAMRSNLQVGDEITTIGGIIGKVVSIKEETCVIETSRDGTKIRILKSAVSRVDVKAEDTVD